MKRGHKHGFTIVELMIVIVVIGILSSITAVMYIGAQNQAQDTKMQDAAQKAIDAVKLFTAQNGHFPAGGDGSSTAIGAAKECADGSGGFFGSGIYTCSVFDTLLASGYLPSDFMSVLPSNTRYSSPTPDATIMLYQIPDERRAVLFIYQKAPSVQAINRFNNIQSSCNVDSWVMSTAYNTGGMRDAYCFDY